MLVAICFSLIVSNADTNETPTVRGLTADNDNKVYGEHGNYDLTIIILCNDHYDFNFNVGMSDDSKK